MRPRFLLSRCLEMPSILMVGIVYGGRFIMQTRQHKLEDDTWLNDVQPVTDKHAIAYEDIPTIPLYLAKNPITCSTPTPSTHHSLNAKTRSCNDQKDIATTISVRHHLWPILFEISHRLWLEVHRPRAGAGSSEPLRLPTANVVKEKALHLLASSFALTETEKELVARGVVDEVLGAGPLEPLLRDETVSAITVYAPHEIVLERAMQTQNTPCQFIDEQHLLRILENLLCQTGQSFRPRWPLAQVLLPVGIQLSITMPPVSPSGPTFTLRKPKLTRRSLSDLVDAQWLDQTMVDFLYTCMQDRRNILICGDVEVDTTSLLVALCACIPEREKTVVIEERAMELPLALRHAIRLVAHPTATTVPNVTMQDVVQHALHMRPQHLVLSQANGEEWVPLLQAMFAGQRGVCACMYAQSGRDAVQRLEMLYRACKYETTPALIRAQIVRALDIVVHVTKMRDGSVRVSNIVEVVPTAHSSLKIQSLFFYREGEPSQGAYEEARHMGGFRPRFLP